MMILRVSKATSPLIDITVELYDYVAEKWEKANGVLTVIVFRSAEMD